MNKVSLDFSNVLRSGYAEDSVVVSTGAEKNISIYYEAQGDIKDWIRFEPADQPILMNANSPASIKVIVEPPSDARTDNYTGKIVISTGPLGAPSGTMGSNILVAFELKVNVKVTDTQILSCNMGGVDFNDIETGYPLDFSAMVSNTGNVRVKPNFRIRIYDQTQTKLMQEINYTYPSEIYPTTASSIKVNFNHSLEPGQYWALVSSPYCDSSETLHTFSVLEKGGISDVGDFVRLENQPWAAVGDIVKITAYFKNRGTRVVTAQFKGVAGKDGKVIEVLNSEKLDVRPSETVPLEFYFRPNELGQYRINGRVYYNNKISFEKGSVLNVDKEAANASSADSNIYYYVIFAIVIVIMIFLLLIIIRKKKRKFRF